jgi:phage-related protein
MPTRSLNVVIAADSRGFHKAANEVDRDTDRLQKRFSVTADSAQGLSLRVGAVAGSLGQMAPVVAGLAPALTGLAGAGAAVGSSFAAAAAGAGALGAGFAASLAPILIIGKQLTSRFDKIKDAYGALKKAQQDHTAASKKAADEAMAGLSKSEQAMARSLGRLSDLQTKVLGGASDRIFGALAGAIDKLAPSLEKLAKPFDRLGGAIADSIGRVAGVLSNGPWQKAFKAFVDSATSIVRPITTVFISVGNIMRDVATAALPMVQDAIKGVAGWFRNLDRQATTGKIREFVKGLVDQTKSWFGLFRELGGLMSRIFGVGSGAGKGFVDTLTHVVRAVNHFIDQMRSGEGAGGKFKDTVTNAFEKVKSTVQRVVASVKHWLGEHRDDIQSVIDAFKRVARFAKTTWEETLLPTIRNSIKAAGPIISGLAGTVRGLVRLVSGLLSGDWDKAWSGAKEAVRGALKAVGKYVATSVGNLAIEMATLGPKLTLGLLKGISNMGKALATGITRAINEAVRAVPGMVAGALGKLGGAITGAISGGLGKITGVGDGLGRGALPSGGAFGGSLKGADPGLRPIAAIGSRFGLGVSDGRRPPGTRTSSGGVSWHSTGRSARHGGRARPGRQQDELLPLHEVALRRAARGTDLHARRNGHQRRPPVHVHRLGCGRSLRPRPCRRRPRPPGTWDRRRSGAAAVHRRRRRAGGRRRVQGEGSAASRSSTWSRSRGARATTTLTRTTSVPPDDSWGFWQINVRPEANPRFKSWHLTNPYVNARAAKILYDGSGLRPWNHAGGPLGDTNVPAARAAVQRFLSGKGGSRGGSTRGGTVSADGRTVTYTATVPGGPGAGVANSGTLTAGPSGSGYTKGPAMFGPAAAGRTDAGRLEQIGLGLAENEGKKTKTAQLLFEEAVIKRRRLDVLKKVLKGRLTKKARTAFTEEATTLIGELRDISTAMYELTGGKAGLSPGGNIAGSKAELAERAADAAKDAPDLPTAGDFVDAAIAEAALTPDTGDDITAASSAVGYWESQLAAARASGDPRKVTAAAVA